MFERGATETADGVTLDGTPPDLDAGKGGGGRDEAAADEAAPAAAEATTRAVEAEEVGFAASLWIWPDEEVAESVMPLTGGEIADAFGDGLESSSVAGVSVLSFFVSRGSS